jgi:hypothetical protein
MYVNFLNEIHVLHGVKTRAVARVVVPLLLIQVAIISG